MSLLCQKPRPARTKPAPAVTSPAAELAPSPPVDDRPGVDVLRLSHEGRGVARSPEGKTLFITGALPQERVTYRVTKQHARYDEAQLETLVHASPDRVTPACVHAETCGGCPLQHLAPSAQQQQKQQQLASLLLPLMPVPLASAPMLSAEPWGYRRRARLGVKWRRDGRLLLGFREAGSSHLAEIHQCLVLEPELDALLAPLYQLIPQLVGGKHLGHLELLATPDGRALLVRLLRPLVRLASQDRQLWQDFARQHQLVLLLDDGEQRETLLASQPLHLPLIGPRGPLQLELTPGAFVQVNAAINQAMLDQALQWLNLQGTERVLDLFCGFGNLTLPLAQQAAQVLGVEVVPAQVAQAQRNAERHQLTQASFVCADLSRPFADQSFMQMAWDVLVLDPPRAGAQAVIEQLPALPKIPRILYISCHPVTLARDVALLQQQGYQIERWGAMDMFPQTAHSEAMVLLSAARPS